MASRDICLLMMRDHWGAYKDREKRSRREGYTTSNTGSERGMGRRGRREGWEEKKRRKRGKEGGRVSE